MKPKYLVLACITLLCSSVYAQLNKDQLHALMVIEVAKNSDFTITGSTYVVTVLGSSSVYAQLLSQSHNLHIKGLPIQIIQVSTIEEAGDSQVIFVPAAMSRSFHDLLKKTKSKPVVIMTEQEDLYKSGAAFSLVESDSTGFRINVNKKVLSERGIKISRALEPIIHQSI